MNQHQKQHEGLWLYHTKSGYHCMTEESLYRYFLEEKIAVKAIVDEQANDDGLWFEAMTAPEAYLQAALRRLHAVIETPTKTEQQNEVHISFGYTELKQFNKFEGGRMVFYGYSITYDRSGKETSRTEPSATSSVGWDNGTPFTEDDYKTLNFLEK